MKVLAIETSSPKASLALFEGLDLLESCELEQPHSQAELLNVKIAQLLDLCNLKFSDLNLFALGVGPGSFTGIRVGMNVAKSYAYLLNLPIYTMNSLDNLLLQQEQHSAIAALNAFNNKVYIGLSPGQPPQVWELEQFKQYLSTHPNLKVVGDVCKLLGPNHPSQCQEAFPSAQKLGQYVVTQQKNLKSYDWKSVSPLYLRSIKTEER
jgi:N6-L-threonylcarbamoyladenine synthase/tRNA threonylcarbamoyladenosine biosynthesis protein TsaB